MKCPHCGKHVSDKRGVIVSEDRIRQLYGEGWSLQRIATLLNVSTNTVVRRLEEMGIPRRQKGWRHPNTDIS